MSCNLKQSGTYALNSVRKDVSANKFVVTLQNPPASCPDGEFTSGSAILKVDREIPSPLLSYSTQKHKLIITVANKGHIQEFNQPEGIGFGGFFLTAIVLAVAGYALYRLFNRPVSYAAGGKGVGGGGNGGSGYARGEGSVAIGGQGGGPGGGPGGVAVGKGCLGKVREPKPWIQPL